MLVTPTHINILFEVDIMTNFQKCAHYEVPYKEKQQSD